ncbi:DUF805 domain-containing protein [Paenarthrobacter aurescens]|uniref:DUF805 domain-containing protein n=1 Tax=Paenarthrobacter aurescens TaxID=43663 RepID=A0A4Y3NIN9_PAEAU|nr:DUF805 domain-containing protein [Paenarthrobacter aurescens]UKA50823.1 DUF805 domain-containing protein [Arthrobacter sp. FW305-123]MDO6142552.1 DUF805 domain-containing protein [Paenarthrobacter aurescens]MDO6146399.1 DUF805 domain-containing protein [Paenarthrobacter aurescens]MDO6157644.1 DUF805 domain-containing protein [Paenarthrobacter aurescens]MDO6161629.1 DUF805 domain-containing protein [Paenarthrobacter aurescens]
MSTYPQQPQQTEQYGVQAGEPPLWAPYYGAPIGAAVKRFFKKYATFSGRASRSEYWWWALVNAVVLIVFQIVMTTGLSVDAEGLPVFGATYFVGVAVVTIWGLATLVPSIALLVRRLHDANLSGWLALLIIVPIVALVLSLLPSNPAGQRFDQPTA